MEGQKAPTSSSGNKTKSSKFPELPAWLTHLISVVIGGIIAMNTSFFAGKETRRAFITEKKCEAFEKAINLLQKSLASSSWIRAELPGGYTPPEKPPTQLEINIVYSLLATYGESGSVTDEFLYAFGFEKNEVGQWVGELNTEVDSPDAIGKFILKLREKMGIRGEGVDPNNFGYIFSGTSKNNK